MADAARSWLGTMLSSIATSSVPRPDTDEKLVEIPGGVEKLRKAILQTQRVELELQTREARYAEAFDACRRDYDAEVAKLRAEQNDIALRLAKLREEWVALSKDLGVLAMLPMREDRT